MDLQLAGKTALVTGSSKGIGAAIVKKLALEGAIVVVHGRTRAHVERVVDEIVGMGGRAHAVLGDLTMEEEVAQLVDDAQRLAGPVAILVNNAGGASDIKEDWPATLPSTWAATYDRNVIAAMRVTGCLLPAMRAAHWGRVINISSLAATMAPAGGADYSAAKAAINAMTASLAKAVALDGITANAISPGTIHSARLDEGFRRAAAARGLPIDAPWEDIERAVLPLFAQVPMGRVGELHDIANAVAFLASPLAGYITGTNLRVDGGLSPCL